ncbi:MAG: GTPase HflX [Gammaproteobacteria bacterium]|nr:GTPase HflX [Gammaproteobacteria bacterium]
MFDRAPVGERALLVHVQLPDVTSQSALALAQQEFGELVRAAGASVTGEVSARCRRIEPRFLIGVGKTREIANEVAGKNIELAIFDCALSPSQERNLEKELRCRVLDRQGLILDIFSQRARSLEGQLQVELAQLDYLSTRLVRGWTHLERQKGGIGLRGPGETQLETDRRLIRQRIRRLKTKLEKIQQQRALGRAQRQRSGMPTVTLVGYTNAGKSTLFNRLTDEDVFVADQVFATLDSTARRCQLPQGRSCVLSDTVGFINDLPHSLVEAFQATLLETREAALLLHVVDASAANWEDQVETVTQILQEIGADQVPHLMVMNKVDMLAQDSTIDLHTNNAKRVWISAQTGVGLDSLLKQIEQHLFADTKITELNLPPTAGALHAKLHDMGAVAADQADERGGWRMKLLLTPLEKQWLGAQLKNSSSLALVE